MSQAQILNQKDYKRLLAATKMTRHADRNRLAVVLSFGAGLRAKEIASVTVDNVIDASGRVKSQFELDSSQTKGRKSRTIFLSEAVQDEIKKYLDKHSQLKTSQHETLYTLSEARSIHISNNAGSSEESIQERGIG